MYIVLVGWDTVLGGTLYWVGHCIGRDTILGAHIGRYIVLFGWDTVLGGTLYW